MKKRNYLLNSLVLVLCIVATMWVGRLLFGDAITYWSILLALLGVFLYRVYLWYKIKSHVLLAEKDLGYYFKEDQVLLTQNDEVTEQHLTLFQQVIRSVHEKNKALTQKTEHLSNDVVQLKRIQESMMEIASAIFNNEDDTKLYQTILDHAVKIIGKGTNGSLLKLGDQNAMHYLALQGYDESLLTQTIDLKKTFLWIATKGSLTEPVIINDILAFNRKHFDETQFQAFSKMLPKALWSAVSAPIHVDGKLFGMINIDSEEAHAFNDQDVALMDFFAKQTAILFKHQAMLNQTRHLMKYDVLTGLNNRSYFTGQMGFLIEKALRYEETFSLIIIDIDGLKHINDRYSHAAGDYALKQFARTLKQFVRRSDMIARFGDDEFAMAFFHSSRESTEKKMALIQMELQNETFVFKDQSLPVRFTFGVAHFPSDAATFDHLLRMADERLYLAKKHKNS